MKLHRVVCAFLCLSIVSTLNINLLMASDPCFLEKEILIVQNHLNKLNGKLLDSAGPLFGTKYRVEAHAVLGITEHLNVLQTMLLYESELLLFELSPSLKKR